MLYNPLGAEDRICTPYSMHYIFTDALQLTMKSGQTHCKQLKVHWICLTFPSLYWYTLQSVACFSHGHSVGPTQQEDELASAKTKSKERFLLTVPTVWWCYCCFKSEAQCLLTVPTVCRCFKSKAQFLLTVPMVCCCYCSVGREGCWYFYWVVVSCNQDWPWTPHINWGWPPLILLPSNF